MALLLVVLLWRRAGTSSSTWTVGKLHTQEMGVVLRRLHEHATTMRRRPATQSGTTNVWRRSNSILVAGTGSLASAAGHQTLSLLVSVLCGVI
jgi:hypothetical protein